MDSQQHPRFLRRPSADSLCRGSVFMMTLVFTGVLALLAVTFGSTVSVQMQLARDDVKSVSAELMAQSGMEYARVQLLRSPAWNGTDPSGILVDDVGGFAVERINPESSWEEPTYVETEISGFRGEGLFVVNAEFYVVPGDLVRTSALASLGGELDVKQSTILGDITVADQLGVIYDWIPTANGGAGGWVLGGPDSLGSIDFTNSTLSGTLRKYTNTVYIDAEQEVVVDGPIYMPQWNLDSYLTPGPDRVIYNNPGTLEDLTLEETAVVILDPGASLTLDDCSFRGGMVIYVEPTYDLRSGPRNEVTLKHSNLFGGGAQGIHPSIGLIAPAAQFRYNSGQEQSFYGLCYWNASDHVNSGQLFQVDGQLIIVNDGFQVMHATLIWNENVVRDPPPGIEYQGDMPSVDITEAYEQYEEIEIPDTGY